MISLVVRPSAELDIREAVDLYEQEDAGLGARLVDELRDAIRRIRQLPNQFPEVAPGTRRALLKRFPYAIYFLMRDVVGSETAIVLAVLHQRRSPTVWRRRVRAERPGG